MLADSSSLGLGGFWVEASTTGVIALEMVGVMKKERALRSDGAFQIPSEGGIRGPFRVRLKMLRDENPVSSQSLPCPTVTMSGHFCYAPFHHPR